MFSHLLNSNFGDSATPLTSPLEPRLKTGKDAAAGPPPRESYDTPMGERRLPRNKDPRKPNYEMIKDARKGILSGFLRSGKILRATEFVGIVNPKTAIITLHDIYDFETRCLAAIENQPISRPALSSIVPFKKVADRGPDDEKTLRNLFFITMAHDELPSFHFWTKPGDLDPVTAGQPVDWAKVFDENPPSPATAAKIAMLENERKEKVQRGAEEQRNTQNERPLGFLDGYNEISSPGLGRGGTHGQPAGGIELIPQTSVAPGLAQSPLEAEVLLQFNRGGMYLREFTHKALYAMACWLIENEEEDEEEEANTDPAGIKDTFLDILEPGKDLREEKVVSVSRASNRYFQDNIKPTFGRPDNKFRIRSTRYQSLWNFDTGGMGDLKYDLKLVRPNVGYCYCTANWHITGDLHSNSLRFGRALKFLFDWEWSAYPNSIHLSLDIPGHGSFDLDRVAGVVVDANIQKIFAELSSTPVKSDSRPVEIFIRDVVEDDTDGSDFIGASPPKHGVLDSLRTDQILGHGSMEATEIGGGPGLPSIRPRLLAHVDINKLQERLNIAEASLIETDDLQERLKIAEDRLSGMDGLQRRLEISEDRARLKSSCPFCPQDWAGVTKQKQKDHLKLHQKDIVHQPAPQKCPQPGCTSWLGENQNESTYEAISEHLRSHIEEEHAEDGICELPRCHTNMYALTGEQQEEHEAIHRDSEENEKKRVRLEDQVLSLEQALKKQGRSQQQVENLEDVVNERDRLQEKVSDLEGTVTERDRLEQQVRHLQNAEKERDRLQENLVDLRTQRVSLEDRVVELERRLRATSGLDEGPQTKEPEPQTDVDGDPKQPTLPEAPKKLRYCNACLKSVDKMSANAKTKHADKCETSVSEFLLLTPAGAKAIREKRNNSRDVVRSHAQEVSEDEVEVPRAGTKRKQKASAKAVLLDHAEDANSAQEPEASKSAGRRTPRRKSDIPKAPMEDELDEDLESPKKPRLKAKATGAAKKGAAPTRRSTRGKDVYEPPDEEKDENEGGDDGEAHDKPSSSARGTKRKKRSASVTTTSKKAKTKR